MSNYSEQQLDKIFEDLAIQADARLLLSDIENKIKVVSKKRGAPGLRRLKEKRTLLKEQLPDVRSTDFYNLTWKV